MDFGEDGEGCGNVGGWFCGCGLNEFCFVRKVGWFGFFFVYSGVKLI